MRFPHIKVNTSMVLFFAIFLLLSCSKDSDLLSEYAYADSGIDENVLNNLLNDDSFVTYSNNSTILDVLANDNFVNRDHVNIVRTSKPLNGRVIIIENSTLLYVPEGVPVPDGVTEENTTEETNNEDLTPEGTTTEGAAGEETTPETDSFTYTTEIVNEDETVATETATVTVEVIPPTSEDTVEETPPTSEDTGQDLSELKTVAQIKADYDLAWNGSINERERYYNIANQGNQGDIYYFGDGIWSLVSMFQVTGERNYLDQAIELTKILMSKAVPSNTLSPNGGYNDSYRSWYGSSSTSITGQGLSNGGQASLYEGRGFRHIAKLLWVLHESPNLRSLANYQNDFDSILEFVEIHIWEKWKNRDSSTYHFRRQTVDPTANMAHIGLFLWKVTGKPQYKEQLDWFNTGSSAGMRNHIVPNSADPQAYMWKRHWDNRNAQASDHGHENRAVALIIDTYELGDFWNEQDMTALRRTLDVFWDPGTDGSIMAEFIDGTQGSDSRPWIEWGWMALGRFDRDLQYRLERRSLSPLASSAKLLHLHYAHLAYNRAFMEGSIIYPENR